MGYTAELEWQNSRDLFLLSESGFIEEAAWVILLIGLREVIVRHWLLSPLTLYDY
jgi:hypothetical protein